MDKRTPKLRRVTFTLVLVTAILIVVAALFSIIANGGKTVFYIKPTEIRPLDNPYMGYASTNPETASDLTYVEVTWAELEPVEGDLDFEGIEEKYNFNMLRAAGKRIVFKLISDRPTDTDHIDIPEWLYDRTTGEHYDNETGKGFSPDYSNLNFMRTHERTITALGKKYGGDDFFAFIEIGSVGHDGNFKVSDEIDITIDRYLLENYIEDYINSFKNSVLLTPGEGYFTEEYGLGEYNPDIADGFDGFTPGKVFGAHIHDDSDYTAATMNIGLSYLVSDSRPSDVVLSNVGYVLKVTEAFAWADDETQSVSVNMTFANSGNAAFPTDKEPVLYVVNSRGNILVKFPLELNLSSIKPGTQASVEETIVLSSFKNERSFRLCVGVQDALTDEPNVVFAMENEIVPFVYNFGNVIL
ncbi:MAG: hypothetical protein LBM41_02670 [Ruminococcus sp.]|jgi:hypothetical protein|nr:hypothetical protein [Ruminococcus sp.]